MSEGNSLSQLDTPPTVGVMPHANRKRSCPTPTLPRASHRLRLHDLVVHELLNFVDFRKDVGACVLPRFARKFDAIPFLLRASFIFMRGWQVWSARLQTIRGWEQV